MRRPIFTLIFMVVFLPAFTQFKYEVAYPEFLLQQRYEKAATPGSKIFAAGVLALNLIYQCKDSLGDVYLEKLQAIAAGTNDPGMIVRAKWWYAYVLSKSVTYENHEKVTRAAGRLMKYADENNFPLYKIAAYNLLSDINIHHDLKECEKNAMTASLWLDDLKDDSIRIEVYSRLAHMFIHKTDGINSARYLLKMTEYAEQDEYTATKVQAQEILAGLYFETGDLKKATALCNSLRNYFAGKKMIYETSNFVYEQTFNAFRSGDRIMMKYYLDRSNALLDSLKINNWYQYWFNFYRYHVGLITTDQYIQLLRTNFNNRFVWPKARTDYEIATTYVSEGRADSARIYYERSRASWDDRYSRYFFDIDGLEVQVLLAGKEYRKAIDKINRIRAVQKQDANVQGYMWSLNLLLQACQGLKDYRAAFDVQAEYNRINDSLTFLNNRQEIAVMEIQKDKEISDRKQREREARQEQRNNLQYLGLGISGIAILILLFLLGLVRAKPWVINLMSFFGFIFIFEFVVLLLDKQIQHLTHDEPWKVLLIKVGVIALIYPLHHFIDEKVSHHLIHKKISLAGWIRSIRGIYKA